MKKRTILILAILSVVLIFGVMWTKKKSLPVKTEKPENTTDTFGIITPDPVK